MLSSFFAPSSPGQRAGRTETKHEFLSASVRLYPRQACATVDGRLCEELSAYGEVARVDTSLVSLLGSITVTYFDVRSAQALLAALPGLSQTHPAADHDNRALQLTMQTFTDLANNVGGFAQFGEVANVQILEGRVVVEFYDMRAAQLLTTATGGIAVPWTPQSTAAPLQPSSAQLQPMYTPQQLSTPDLLQAFPIAAKGPPGLGGTDQDAFPKSLPSPAVLSVDTLSTAPGSPKTPAADKGSKTGRTKVSTKEFSKYDIYPERIISGEDQRTTCMVRNLASPNARKDFLKFLEKAGLSENCTFFYMPCKEHRKVPAGFAFVNFASPDDVLSLNTAVNGGLWGECATDPQPKPLALSYARFQGQEDLMKHFSASAVLHEQDPDKRPIFRTSNSDLKDLSPTSSGPTSNGSTNATRQSKKKPNVTDMALASTEICNAAADGSQATSLLSGGTSTKLDASMPLKVSTSEFCVDDEALMGA